MNLKSHSLHLSLCLSFSLSPTLSLSLLSDSNQNILSKRILDRIIFTTMTSNLGSVDSVSYVPNTKNNNNNAAASSSAEQSKIIDQISINCKIKKVENISEEDINNNYYYLESELRSTILQFSLLDVHMCKLPEGVYAHSLFHTTFSPPSLSLSLFLSVSHSLSVYLFLSLSLTLSLCSSLSVSLSLYLLVTLSLCLSLSDFFESFPLPLPLIPLPSNALSLPLS